MSAIFRGADLSALLALNFKIGTPAASSRVLLPASRAPNVRVPLLFALAFSCR